MMNTRFAWVLLGFSVISPVLADEVSPPEAAPVQYEMALKNGDVITVPQSAPARPNEALELAVPNEKFETFPLAPLPAEAE